MEYADRKEDTQHFLKSLLQPFMIEVTRRFAIDKSDIRPKSISEQIMDYEEISAMLGYSNHSNFYKAFKEYYGITPREYQHSKAT